MNDHAYKKRVTVQHKSTPNGNRMLISTHWSPGSRLNRRQARQSCTNNQPVTFETESAEKQCKQLSSDSDSDISVGDNEYQQDSPVVPVSDGVVIIHRHQKSTTDASCGKQHQQIDNSESLGTVIVVLTFVNKNQNSSAPVRLNLRKSSKKNLHKELKLQPLQLKSLGK